MKRVVFESLYERILAALADPTRRAILSLLLENKSEMSFTQIKRALGISNNGTLSHHLNILQRACLVERTADLTDPRTAEDPYYCFYNLTWVGQMVMKYLTHMREEIRRAFATV